MDTVKQGMWSLRDIMAFRGVGRSTAYKIVSQPDFPKADRSGGTHPRWFADEVRNYFRQAA
jgi:predicted DNA-binding transcriptional regulator AlpA